MPKQKQPIKLLQAKGKKHLTKAEIAERESGEVAPVTDGIAPPEYLSEAQARRFDELAADLIALGIMGKTDCDALARYLIAEEMYVFLTGELNNPERKDDIYLLEKYSNLQDKYFKQCRAAASDLGLTITSRCRLVVPKADDKPKVNKFNSFAG